MNITIILLLAGIGILNTLYLTYHAINKTHVKCIGFPPEWCRKVQASKYSKTLGIPNPYLGLLMYVAIVVLAILFLNGIVSFWPITVIVLFGFAFSLYFIIIQAFVIKAFCTWCVLSAIDFLLLAAVLLVGWL